MEALGAEVLTVTEPDPIGGLLASAVELRPGAVRLGPALRLAQPVRERRHLAGALPPPPARRSPGEFPDLDVLFVGAGTTGTLMGCARYFRALAPVGARSSRSTPVGSVSFGTPAAPPDDPGPRHGRPPAGCSTSRSSTRSSTSRRPTPSAPATGWPDAGSCSVAPQAPWSAQRRAGWTSTAPTTSPRSPSPRTWASATSPPIYHHVTGSQDLYGDDVLSVHEAVTSRAA